MVILVIFPLHYYNFQDNYFISLVSAHAGYNEGGVQWFWGDSFLPQEYCLVPYSQGSSFPNISSAEASPTVALAA
jgi:hypothetical protein